MFTKEIPLTTVGLLLRMCVECWRHSILTEVSWGLQDLYTPPSVDIVVGYHTDRERLCHNDILYRYVILYGSGEVTSHCRLSHIAKR